MIHLKIQPYILFLTLSVKISSMLIIVFFYFIKIEYLCYIKKKKQFILMAIENTAHPP